MAKKPVLEMPKRAKANIFFILILGTGQVLFRRLLINFSKTKILEKAANMQNVNEFEKSSIRKNWQQDSANDLSRGSLRNLSRAQIGPLKGNQSSPALRTSIKAF